MSARAALQTLLEDLLEEGEPLALLGFTDVMATNSVDTPPDEKFIIVRWEEKQQQVAAFGPQRVSIWLHSRDKDYGPIDEGLREIQPVVEAAVHLAGSDGWTLTQADWRGDSQDLFDDGYGTITKFSSFDVVSRYATTQI